jgi:ABC-type Fe3+/spermidine/putrescine transport system ATPase subunit
VDSAVGETALISIRGGFTIQAPSRNLTLTAPVVVALRKERIRISRDRLDMDNVFKGEIRGVRFLGNSKEYLVRIPNGDLIAAHRFAESEDDTYDLGDNVQVGFLEGDAMVFEYPTHGLSKELEVE